MDDNPHFTPLDNMCVSSELGLGLAYVCTDEHENLLFYMLQHILVGKNNKKY